MQTVGLALIVKDEEKNLPRLLESVSGAFDQIVLVDTGSTDRTVDIYNEWDGCDNKEVYYFEWIKDFAAARNYADSFLTTDWCVWADADDVIIGAQNIRQIVNNAHPGVVGFICGYDYAQHPETGACVCFLKRERIVKKGHSHWDGHVHEAQIVTGGAIQYVDPSLVQWKHQKMVAGNSADEVAALQSNDRNIEILLDWNEKEPGNARVLAYLGTEHGIRGKHEEAIRYYEEFLQLENNEWSEQKAQVYRKLCESLMATNHELDVVERLALEAIGVMPQWPDSYITLTEVYLARGDFDKALHWSSAAVERGVPDTLLIVNPLDYTFGVKALKARSLAGLNRYDEAVEVAEDALRDFPDITVMQAMMEWKGVLKYERTADTFCMCAEQLINHDEQLKALTLLEQCVPHFSFDHPKIVGLRSMLRERLMWVKDPQAFQDHYEFGGSKPEDFIADEDVDELCSKLPRAGFILDGLGEFVADGG